MRFRELFEKYLKGQTTPEETEIVENELEKNEVLNDYLADLVDNSFLRDESLVTAGTEAKSDDCKWTKNDKMLQEVQRAINKKLRLIALFTAISVCSFFLTLKFAISPLVNRLYYNPAIALSNFSTKFDIDISTFTELHFPGVITSKTHSESLGFGKYSIKINQSNFFERKNNSYEGKVEHGRLKYMNQEFYQFPYINAFRYGVYPLQPFPENDNPEITELKAMPESAHAKVYVSFKEDITIDQVVALMEEQRSLYFSWIAVRSCPRDIQQLPQFGFEPTGSGPVYEKGVVDDHKYPHFELAYEKGSLSAEVLTIHFKSLVRYMRDSKDFLKLIGSDPTTYQRTLQYVEANGVNSYGALVIGSCSEILKLRENPVVDSIRIDNIKLSTYSN
jgi:hypothetical protein